MRKIIFLSGIFFIFFINSTFADEPKKILFFGNSFTMFYQIFNLVGELAVVDGKPAPIIKTHTRGGKDLNWHLTQIEAEGKNNVLYQDKWDCVVIQEYSSGPTSINQNIGPEKFLANALKLYDYIAKQAPEAKIVMYETWARSAAQEHIYTDGYTMEKMQQELHTGYTLAAKKINEKAGKMIAKIAPAGQVWKKYGWDPILYNGPLDRTRIDYHQGPKGALINAMTIYATIYHEKVSDIPIERATSIIANLTTQAPSDLSQEQLVTEKDFLELAKSVDETMFFNSEL